MKTSQTRHLAVIGGLLCLVVLFLLVLPECRSRALVHSSAADSSNSLKTPGLDLQKVYITFRQLREDAASPKPRAPRVSTPRPIERPVRGTAEALPTESARKEESPFGKPREKKLKVERAPAYAGSAREIGRQLLGIEGKNEGAVPLITMDYRRTLGWPGYVREMLKLGGLFFIYDNSMQRIRAQVDAVHGKISPTGGDLLKGLSPRMREIKSEIAVAGLMEEAQKTLGRSDYSLVLLLPLNVDADIIGAIAKGLADHNIDIQTIGHIVGEHERSGTRICFHVKQVVRRDGTVEPFDIVLAF